MKNAKVIELHEGGSVSGDTTSSIRGTSDSADDALLSTRDVLNRIKDELGLDTDLELADVMGVGIRRIHNWKHRNTVPTEEIVAICGKEGLDLQYVLTGQKIGLGRSDGQQAGTMQMSAPLTTCSFDPDYMSKPRDSFSPSSCGHPLIHPPYKAYTQRSDNGEVLNSFASPQIVDVLAPGLNWLNHSLGVAPENFLLIKVLGDNMAPWLQDGDLVMVDAGIKTTINGGCLVLRYSDGMMMVRRVFRNPDGTFLAKCDNECCPPDIIDPNNNMTYPIVVGRVVRRLVR